MYIITKLGADWNPSAPVLMCIPLPPPPVGGAAEGKAAMPYAARTRTPGQPVKAFRPQQGMRPGITRSRSRPQP